MTQYRVVGEMAVVLSDKDGAIVAHLKPGLVIEGDLEHSCTDSVTESIGAGIDAAKDLERAISELPVDKPKRRKGYADKAVRAERDYSDKADA